MKDSVQAIEDRLNNLQNVVDANSNWILLYILSNCEQNFEDSSEEVILLTRRISLEFKTGLTKETKKKFEDLTRLDFDTMVETLSD